MASKWMKIERDCVRLVLKMFPGAYCGRWAASKGPRYLSYDISTPVDVTGWIPYKTPRNRMHYLTIQIQVKHNLKTLSKKERDFFLETCAELKHIPLLSNGKKLWFCRDSYKKHIYIINQSHFFHLLGGMGLLPP